MKVSSSRGERVNDLGEEVQGKGSSSSRQMALAEREKNDSIKLTTEKISSIEKVLREEGRSGRMLKQEKF